MSNRLAIIVVGIFSTIFAGSAEACRRQWPVTLPIHRPEAVVTQGVVVGGDAHGAEVRLDLGITGPALERTIWLDYGTRPTPSGEVVITSCGPPGPVVGIGAPVIVAFLGDAGQSRTIGWMRLADAERADEFFVLYRTESRPAARRGLIDRWQEVNRRGGPIPLTDPSRWMTPYTGGPRFEAVRDRSRAVYQVDPEGRVSDCQVLGPGETSRRDRWMCERIRRQRFRPPFFARERRGVYEARWTERVEPVR